MCPYTVLAQDNSSVLRWWLCAFEVVAKIINKEHNRSRRGSGIQFVRSPGSVLLPVSVSRSYSANTLPLEDELTCCATAVSVNRNYGNIIQCTRRN